MSEIAKLVTYEGHVQGVGFRYTVKQIAHGYDVSGWVKNLFDGRVEMRVRGEPEEIADFLLAIRSSVLARHIHSSQESDLDELEVSGFSIR